MTGKKKTKVVETVCLDFVFRNFAGHLRGLRKVTSGLVVINLSQRTWWESGDKKGDQVKVTILVNLYMRDKNCRLNGMLQRVAIAEMTGRTRNAGRENKYSGLRRSYRQTYPTRVLKERLHL